MLMRFDRILVPMEEVARKLARNDLPCIDCEARHYFSDVLDHVRRIEAMVSGLREVLTSVFEFSNLGNQRIIGLTVGARRHQRDMIRAIGAEGIRPIIDRHFPLEQIADAFRHQESGRHSARSAWISDSHRAGGTPRHCQSAATRDNMAGSLLFSGVP